MQVSGALTLAGQLDWERQRRHSLRIEAYDLGLPTPLQSDLDLLVRVVNINDHPPRFPVRELYVNMTENRAPGAERRPLLETVDQDAAAVDSEDNDDDDSEDKGALQSDICYFLIGGNDRGLFDVNPASHELTVLRSLDREETAVHHLFVWATEDCASRQQPPSLSLKDDSSVLHIVVTVLDVNDNPPEFTQPLFTGGVSTDVAFGTEFMRVAAVDRDEGPNAEIEYLVCGDIEAINTEGFGSTSRQPFLADPLSGGILLNFDPQPHQKGYFSFSVCAKDQVASGSSAVTARATVTVYLLREDQRVRFVMRAQPEEIRACLVEFSNMLANATGAIVNVDRFQVHASEDDSSNSVLDASKTDVLLHFVHPTNNSVMEVADILRTLDYRTAELGPFFKEFDVLTTDGGSSAGYKTALRTATLTMTETMVMFWLVGGCIFLGLVLVVVLAICLSQRTSYARKLKALATQAGENFSSATTTTTVETINNKRVDLVPNTNKHAGEGSNPIWMTGQGFQSNNNDDSWAAAQEEPEVSFYAEAAMDSLDSNILNQRTEGEVNFSESSLLGSSNTSPGSTTRPVLLNANSKELEQHNIESRQRRPGSTSRHSDSSGRGSSYESSSTVQLATVAADKLGWRPVSAMLSGTLGSRVSGPTLLTEAATSGGRERLNNNPLARL